MLFEEIEDYSKDNYEGKTDLEDEIWMEKFNELSFSKKELLFLKKYLKTNPDIKEIVKPSDIKRTLVLLNYFGIKLEKDLEKIPVDMFSISSKLLYARIKTLKSNNLELNITNIYDTFPKEFGTSEEILEKYLLDQNKMKFIINVEKDLQLKEAKVQREKQKLRNKKLIQKV